MHRYGSKADPRAIIQELRRQRRYRSVRALAIAADIAQPTLQRYLAGKTAEMDLSAYVRLSHALGVTMSELLGEVPLSNSSVAREASRILEALSPERQSQWLRIGNVLAAEDETPGGRT